ncbi:hypothetical protein CPB86DRAFT_789007 [Serendipita vermifera]|nr:hypothetical protein CPB86DRAFT_789007 [Serendipita vermifera]
MKNKRNSKKSSQKRAPAPVHSTNANTTAILAAKGKSSLLVNGTKAPATHQITTANGNPPSSSGSSSFAGSPVITRSSSPTSTNASKTSFVRPPLALTKLQHEHSEEGVEPYSPNDPYFPSPPHHTYTHHQHPNYTPAPHEYIHDPGIEPADPQVIRVWEQNLRKRLQQAYPRMCYFFLCDKDLFILVTVLTVQRMAKADMLSGRPVGKRKDRQFVDDIAHCMSDAEVRYDKDEEWMTWWRETLLTVQAGLQRGWIHADSPNIVYAKDIMKLYRRFTRITRRLADVDS